MARRPASESYQSMCSRSGDMRTVGLEDEEDAAPIFSLSRSSMDVVMAAGPPHKRDPAWTTMDMRRSSSTNTHPDNHLVALKQLPPHMWQHMNVTNSLQVPLVSPNLDGNTSPVLSERWLANTQRWSQSSSGTHSRSSTLDTIVGRDGSPRPCSLPPETPDPHLPKPKPPSCQPSSLVSPSHTPDLLPEGLPASPVILSPGQHKDLFSPTSSPLASPHQAYTSSPLASPHQAYTSSPLASPHQAYTSSPLESPHQAYTSSPLASPHQAYTSSPLASPHQAYTSSPLASPHQAYTSSPLASPHQAYTSSPLASPHQAYTSSPLASPHQAYTSSPLASPHQAYTSSPLASPHQAYASSPLASPHQAYASSPLASPSSTPLQLAGTEGEGSPENGLSSFTFPSPVPSSASLAGGCDASDRSSCAVDAFLELQRPERSQMFEKTRMSSTLENPSDSKLSSSRNKEESLPSNSFLGPPGGPGQPCWTNQSSGSLLVCSVSDSQLGKCCRCSRITRESSSKAARSEVSREEATMTSQPELLDVEVQTETPTGSLWGLRRNGSTSNMGSPSILGSPPGSRLNLKSSVGSNSNLVSPSSSMFPMSSEEEEEKCGDGQMAVPPHNPDRRRSCLKNPGEEGDDPRRRSSMKQVQWDEDGMTWDIHGASPDPEDLSTAIQKHMEVQNNQPVKRPSKKKKAPKPPVNSPPVQPSEDKNSSGKKTDADVERKREDTPDRGRKRDKKKEAGAGSESDARTEEKEASSPAQNRKRSVIRSLRRPGWCGGSRKIDD